MLRVHRMAAEPADGVPVEHVRQILVIPDMDLLDFMGSAETIKEMHNRHAAFNGGKMSNGA